MDPQDLSKKLARAHAAAEQVYHDLVRPDRPLEPLVGHKPWLAVFLSLVVGAGQLYNRQLAKAVGLFALFYLGGGALLLFFWSLNWASAINERLPAWLVGFEQRLHELRDAALIIWASLWLFAIVDAGRTAADLRSGRLLIRYGFRRQVALALARFLPLAGKILPSETVRADEANRSMGDRAKDFARKRLIKRFLLPLGQIGCLGLGILLLTLGVLFEVHVLYTLGALGIAAGFILFLK